MLGTLPKVSARFNKGTGWGLPSRPKPCIGEAPLERSNFTIPGSLAMTAWARAEAWLRTLREGEAGTPARRSRLTDLELP